MNQFNAIKFINSMDATPKDKKALENYINSDQWEYDGQNTETEIKEALKFKLFWINRK